MKTRLRHYAFMALVLAFCVPTLSPEGLAQAVLRGKILASDGKPASRATIESLDFVTNTAFDSTQTGNDGFFSLSLRHTGLHRVRFSVATRHELLARIYIQHLTDVEVRFTQDSSVTPRLIFKDSTSRTAKLFAIYNEIGEELARFRTATRNRTLRPGESSKGIFDWSPHIFRSNQQLNSETDSTVRQALFIARLVPSFFGDTLSPAAARLSLNSISPRHPFWEEANILCNSSIRADYLTYLDTVIETHPDPWTRALTMFTYLPLGRATHDSTRVHRFAARLLSEFPGSTISRMAIPFASIAMRDLSGGDPMPPFSFADLHRPEAQISSHQFRGKVSLIVFWATWCIHCVEQLPFLRAAHDRYENIGLEILSVSLDDNPQSATSFLKARPLVPWRQAYAIGGFNNEYVKQLGVYAAPAEFLVDKNGRVLATTNDLIRSKLDTTLSRFFGK